MSIAYAVSSGSYSDYQVLAIFTTKEKAEIYAKTMDDAGVEEFLLDPTPDEKILELVLSGDHLWLVRMSLSGDCPAEPYKVKIGHKYGYSSIILRSEHLTATVRARDADAAIKIMNEYRIRYLHERPEVLLKGENID